MSSRPRLVRNEVPSHRESSKVRLDPSVRREILGSSVRPPDGPRRSANLAGSPRPPERCRGPWYRSGVAVGANRKSTDDQKFTREFGQQTIRLEGDPGSSFRATRRAREFARLHNRLSTLWPGVVAQKSTEGPLARRSGPDFGFRKSGSMRKGNGRCRKGPRGSSQGDEISGAVRWRRRIRNGRPSSRRRRRPTSRHRPCRRQGHRR